MISSFYIISMYIDVILFSVFISLLVMNCKKLGAYLCYGSHFGLFFIFTVVMCDNLWLKRKDPLNMDGHIL